jgi:hypothetical protein
VGEGGAGLRDDPPPRAPAVGWAFGLGTLWGLLGYAILWEGEPVAVGRPFVQSLVGTLVLLPVRIVLWGIRAAEGLADRTFDLSSTHAWIAPVAGAIGAAIAVAATWSARGVVRRLRRGTGAGFDTRR